MKQRPILFSTPMVQAILEGRKTQTRRIVKPGIIILKDRDKQEVFAMKRNKKGIACPYECPYGQPGDYLWVRETWQHTKILNLHPTDENYGYIYKADGQPWEDYEGWVWKPSIFMPKAAARIWLKIVDVRIERLQDISESDAECEGVEEGVKSIPSFNSLWESIHGEESWNQNPHVWVIEFNPVNKPENI